MLTIELLPQRTQTEFNLRRWSELVADPFLEQIEGRIETDRFGHIIMSPPPAPSHGSYQSEISYLLRNTLSTGRVLTECPISTADGVKAADVAWASARRMKDLGDKLCFTRAPEICVEVMSPSNSEAEMREKMALYFDAGAKAVWLCSENGVLSFFNPGATWPMRASELCPGFPRRITLR
jgi:Uma2 family endonuclease